MIKSTGIETQNLTVGYKEKIIVDNINISVERGKILTLIGPNGSGKSTILKTIIRQLKALDGNIYADGKSITSSSEKELSKIISAVMTEKIHPEFMTCRDVVSTGRYPYTGKFGILSSYDHKKVENALSLVNAIDIADYDFSKISDGQRQRIMLARAICQNTAVIILDEPTSFLDMRYKLDILGSIRTLAKEKNIAVIMSLHELDLAEKISDTVVCIDGNKVGRIGTPEKVFKGDYIQKLYKIPAECFDPVLGILNLKGNKADPKVFVIGGAGEGIAIYQKLQRENIPFAAGILSRNDVEFSTANALGKVIYTEAFYPIEEKHIEEAKKIMDKCEKCICAIKKFGPYNEGNRILLEYAKKTGKLENNVF